MAQRAQWKGFIKFGEVSCGVGLYTAASTSERRRGACCADWCTEGRDRDGNAPASSERRKALWGGQEESRLVDGCEDLEVACRT